MRASSVFWASTGAAAHRSAAAHGSMRMLIFMIVRPYASRESAAGWPPRADMTLTLSPGIAPRLLGCRITALERLLAFVFQRLVKGPELDPLIGREQLPHLQQHDGARRVELGPCRLDARHLRHHGAIVAALHQTLELG